MIDSTTQKQVVAIRKNNQIAIKLYLWFDIYRLEEYLDQKLGIEIDFFKPIKDENGNEIGCELIFDEFQDIELLQTTMDEIE